MRKHSLKAACVLGLSLSFFLVNTGLAQSSAARIEVDLNPPAELNPLIQPEFPGGFGTLNTYLKENVRYPAAAAQANIKGFVLISYLIDELGNVTAIKVMKGLGYGCDEEALRVVRQMPRWKPAQQSGKATPVKYNLPVHFPPN
ncbi:energy transducer TonB [Spirosoma linguale]|uniref:TonB family protein n=1 Tax=Spirosoma linguale (strain ATCC 33905 / DSM 74 / LMG 10896 / Claus 1) TaxID=504472 RepID=D2QQ97_SPILD|nr:TonB family protein [Spirosoma linguale DSM 74]